MVFVVLGVCVYVMRCGVVGGRTDSPVPWRRSGERLITGAVRWCISYHEVISAVCRADRTTHGDLCADCETFRSLMSKTKRTIRYRTKDGGGVRRDLRLRHCDCVAVEQKFNTNV